MRLFIPPLKTRITLTKQWNFDLICEPRNARLWDLYGPPSLMAVPIEFRRANTRAVQLDVGDVLIVDRIFLRQGATMYDSVTFKGEVLHAGNIHRVRFWVPLADTHNIEGDITAI